MQHDIIIEFNCCTQQHPLDVIGLISTCILNVKCKHGVLKLHSDPNDPWCWECLGFDSARAAKKLWVEPHTPWNFLNLAQNPNITWDIVRRHRDLPWNYDGLSQNRNINRVDLHQDQN